MADTSWCSQPPGGFLLRHQRESRSFLRVLPHARCPKRYQPPHLLFDVRVKSDLSCVILASRYPVLKEVVRWNPWYAPPNDDVHYKGGAATGNSWRIA
eukprot:2726487-Rhodomonas_salina.1